MIISLILFFSSLTLYLSTMPGTVPAYRDSGDMINAIWTLGIAHPPGYPAYVLIGKLFATSVPLGNPAYRVNLLSAVSAAAATAFLYRLISRYLVEAINPQRDRGVLIATALVSFWFACTPAVVSLARVAEMYALAGFFAVAILSLAIHSEPATRWVGGLLLAIGIGVHPTLLVLIPLLLPILDRAAKNREQWVWQAVIAGMGLTILLLPMVRSWTDPVQNWGNPHTLTDLWRLLSRSNYGGLKLHPEQSHLAWTAGGVIDQGALFLDIFRAQWSWTGIGLGILGLAWGLQDKLPLTRRRFAVWLLAGPIFVVLANLPPQEKTTVPILEPYFVLTNAIWVLWIAEFVIRLVARLAVNPALAYGTVAILAFFPTVAGWQVRSSRADLYASETGRNMLRSLPRDAVLVEPDDPIAFTLRNLQLTEGRRLDVVPLNFFRTRWGYEQILRRWPDLLPPVPINTAQELERVIWTYSIRKRPLYTDLPQKIPSTLGYLTEGLVYCVLPGPGEMNDEEFRHAEDLSELYAWRGSWSVSDHPDFFTRQVLNYRSAAECNLGMQYAQRRLWDLALLHYRKALVIDPQLAPAFNNLGVLYFSQHQWAAAIDHYRLALRFDPGNPGFQRNLELALDAQQSATR